MKRSLRRGVRWQTGKVCCCAQKAPRLTRHTKPPLNAGGCKRDESAVLFNCGSGLKYPMPEAGAPLDRHAAFDITAL